ncbi:MAG: nucleoside recognition domain-containing protein [Patescibacteria group bacterium]
MNVTGAGRPWTEIAGWADAHRGTDGERIHDLVVRSIYNQAERIAAEVVHTLEKKKTDWDRRIDDLVTSGILGYPIMLLLLGAIFWLTVKGANYPSAALARLFFGFEARLTTFFRWLGAPAWMHGVVVLGTYRTLAWVVSVMLPPMAIFFPLFTLLEDLGYLPRVAFNLDRFFKTAGADGKQALTMAMGFGCNAAGVIAARIIQSPRERLIAILTNNFVPCNGRFPTLIAISTIFVGANAAAGINGAAATAMVVGLVLIGILVSLLVSWTLSKTVLRGVPSSFTLELPPYRPPQILRVIIRSIFDRTLFVLYRAMVVAAPAGAVIWILANTHLGGTSILNHLAGFFEPVGRGLGLDGVILLAFILGLPANEIVVPIVIMSYLSTGAMLELESLAAMRDLLVSRGWTCLTALNVMLFSLLHFPCGTTLLTMRKETGGLRWPALAFLMNTAIAVAVCFLTAQGARLLGLV